MYNNTFIFCFFINLILLIKYLINVNIKPNYKTVEGKSSNQNVKKIITAYH